MKIILYVRTFPVKGAPVAYSFFPSPPHQRHTYTRDGTVYEAVSKEMGIHVPDGAVLDVERRLLCWTAEKGRVKSTVNEVYDLVQAGAPGFGKAK